MHDALVSYPLRSSGAFKVGLGVAVFIAAVSILGVLGLILFVRPVAIGLPFPLVLLLVVLVVTVVTLARSASSYLVPGGHGSLDLYSDRVEIKTARGVDTFQLDELQIQLKRFVHRRMLLFLTMDETETDTHLELRTPDQKRVLSRRLFDDPDTVTAVAH